MKKIIILASCFWINFTWANGIKINKAIGYDHFLYQDKLRNKDIPVTIYYPISQAEKINNVSNIKTDDFIHANYINKAPIREKKQYPFIMISHGWGGNEKFLSWLSDALVSSGFITCFVNHDDSQGYDSDINYYNRATDLSNTLTYLLSTKNAIYIDQNKIGLAGFSLGGTTSVWLLGGMSENYNAIINPTSAHNDTNIHPSISKQIIDTSNLKGYTKNYQDKRFKAGLLLSPAWGEIFTTQSLNNIDVPTLIIDSVDSSLKAEFNSVLYAKNIPYSLLKFVPGDHLIFRNIVDHKKINTYDSNGKLANNFSDPKKINRKSIHKIISKNAVFFFKQIFDQKSMYYDIN